MTEDFIAGVFLGCVSCLIIALTIALVREVIKAQDKVKNSAPPTDNRITDVVVDAIGIHVDTYSMCFSVSLLVDASWVNVYDGDPEEIKKRALVSGSQFRHYVTPINAVKKLQRPIEL